jgi:NTP pyrophosphatase (non-canonical NTP hydrolase)
MGNLYTLQKTIKQINQEKGWYDRPRSFGDDISLIHSELSECLEVYRKGATAKIGEELADVLIRTLDFAERLGLDMDELVSAKLIKNQKRPYRHGDKIL